MVILKRKQLIMMTMFIFLSVFTFMFSTAKQEKNEIQETVVLPVSRKNRNT